MSPRYQGDTGKRKKIDWREKSFIAAISEIMETNLGKAYIQKIFREGLESDDTVELSSQLSEMTPEYHAFYYIMETAVNYLAVSTMNTVKEEALQKFIKHMEEELEEEEDDNYDPTTE